MSGLMLFPGAVKRDRVIEEWMQRHSGVLGAIARHGLMRRQALFAG